MQFMKNVGDLDQTTRTVDDFHILIIRTDDDFAKMCKRFIPHLPHNT